ncbi:carboxypeptidase regulatory-like domain-containing protein [Sinimarinibacterium sp. CAU 1509]|uniref:carboxypeptidase-like regulatory domain-containing protein n=1 Tax=Sinimarinibacterium sp. CAU 1509 TaxID=2562283 RepID=UPI0010ABAD54|nr:carboxypeptidase-like regulatory domain-containing protein [Sinimarinibacterium sp. CAU 1509]TJY61070.1 carboxypeptidase regulatory-like domain-containing protein [Sinimarinibacterium sp. CAU 1509]
MRTYALLLLLPAVLLGCDSDGDVVCTNEAVFGILVDPRDAVSNAPLAAHATGRVQDGSYTEDFMLPGSNDGLLSAAEERPGTYSIIVEHEGYQTWTLDNVEVKDGICHVNTVRLTAGLEPVE